jgi:hypothetical protein
MKRLILIFTTLLLPIVLQAQEIHYGLGYGRQLNGETKVLLLDNDGFLVTSEFSHFKTHRGYHWTASWDSTLNDGDSIYFLIHTGADEAHVLFLVDGFLHIRKELYRSATHTSNGDTVLISNNNHTKDYTNTMTVTRSNNDGSDGTLFYKAQTGGDTGGGANLRASGGQIRGDTEWVLPASSTYMIMVASYTDNNNISLEIEWYEH